MKKTGLLLVMVLLLVAIPATIFLVGKNQELRQKAAPATSLSITPAIISKKVGDTFSMEITIDTGANQVVAAELHLVFDPDKLEAQTITNGTLFPNILASGIVDRGTASITVGAQSSTSPVTGKGTVAVVKFKALAATTTTPASIRLASNTFVGSLGEGSTNVLVGSTPANVTITDGTGGGTASALTATTPSSTASATMTPTPTPTVKAGGFTATGSGQASPSAIVIKTPVKDASTATETPTISGKAAPGATITLTIYSTPQTVVVVADANGNWTYTPTTPLDPGPHSVVATSTDPSGATQTSTASFVVAAAGQSATQSAQPVSGGVEVTYALIALAIILLASGIAVPIVIK